MAKVTTKRLAMQKRLAARQLGISPKRVKINHDRISALGMDIAGFKESITKADIRKFIHNDLLSIVPKRGISRGRARHHHRKRQQGRHSGSGSKKGKKGARANPKRVWMNQIRSQRKLLFSLRVGGQITQEVFREMYGKASGGFFRSQRHIRLYLEEHELYAPRAKVGAV